MKKIKNYKYTVEDVFNLESDFWIFSSQEVEYYYWESFVLKHKKKVIFFDCSLVLSFIVYVMKDLFVL